MEAHNFKSEQVLKCKQAQVNHFKSVNEAEDEFYRCCFVSIKHKMINNPADESEKKQNQILMSTNLELRYEEDD